MTLVGRWVSSFWNWIVGPEFDDDVKKIRLATERTCGFVPTVATVASIITAANPTVVGVAAIALAICQAVTRHKMAVSLYSIGDFDGEKITAPPTLNGIVIEGEWVK
jgi:hypothetical protein